MSGLKKNLTEKQIAAFFDLLKSQLLHDFEGNPKAELNTLKLFHSRLKEEKIEHLEAAARNIIVESKYKKFPTIFVIEDVLNTLFPMRAVVKEVSVDKIKENIETQVNEETEEWLKVNKMKTPEELKTLIEQIVEEKTRP